MSHISKIELEKSDIAKTCEKYVQENPDLVVRILYLDVDLYEATKILLENFVSKMPKGAIVVFDELNAKMVPGETCTVDEILGIINLKIERLSFDSYVSYAVL